MRNEKYSKPGPYRRRAPDAVNHTKPKGFRNKAGGTSRFAASPPREPAGAGFFLFDNILLKRYYLRRRRNFASILLPYGGEQDTVLRINCYTDENGRDPEPSGPVSGAREWAFTCSAYLRFYRHRQRCEKDRQKILLFLQKCLREVFSCVIPFKNPY